MQMFGSAFSGGKASDQDLYGMSDGITMLIAQTGASPQTGCSRYGSFDQKS